MFIYGIWCSSWVLPYYIQYTVGHLSYCSISLASNYCFCIPRVPQILIQVSVCVVMSRTSDIITSRDSCFLSCVYTVLLLGWCSCTRLWQWSIKMADLCMIAPNSVFLSVVLGLSVNYWSRKLCTVQLELRHHLARSDILKQTIWHTVLGWQFEPSCCQSWSVCLLYLAISTAHPKSRILSSLATLNGCGCIR